jgi:hypothetical protein
VARFKQYFKINEVLEALQLQLNTWLLLAVAVVARLVVVRVDSELPQDSLLLLARL